ncbi:MAG: carboxypeptidase regulatory-like domain-containing protein [Bdellovibrionales bacterium]|nr:carboxypeptidase regulatory-like domain-containing protein [Bdellovibrionales bacterium]
MKGRKLWLITFLALALISCSEDKDKDKGGDKEFHISSFQPDDGLIDWDVDAQNQGLRIVDEEGQPIAGASVLLGNEIDSPFKGNQILSDEDGYVAIPKSWTTDLPVTIEAPGYIRMTYTRVEPADQDLQLHKQEGKDFIEVKGITTDYGRLRSDGYIDFSLIIPAFTQRSMINFDISSVISPVSDTISVAGQKFDLPSNISLPHQRESYIIPITFEKPEYRAFIRNPGFYKMFATHGRFPFKNVVDELRAGSSIFEVINMFDFKGGGQKDLQINKSVDKQDISIRQIAFDQSVQVKAPTFNNDLEMISLALVNQGGYFYPADLKRVKPGQEMTLKYPASATDSYLLSALVHKDAVPANSKDKFSQEEIIDLRSFFTLPSYEMNPLNNSRIQTAGLSLSLSFEKGDNNDPVSFIDFVDAPIINGNTMTLDVPQIHGEISPMATYVTFSEVETLGTGKVQSEKKTRIWEFIAGGWQQQIQIPQLNIDTDANKSYRWEVLFLGRKGNSPATGGYLLDGITHVSRSSYNF